MQQTAHSFFSRQFVCFVPAESGAREAALLEAVAELSARFGDAVPAYIIDDVLSGTSAKLPRNADGSVSVRDYAEWHYAIGEAVARELDRF